jgi:hypothetical protein
MATTAHRRRARGGAAVISDNEIAASQSAARAPCQRERGRGPVRLERADGRASR